MISGAALADVCLLMVPADNAFTSAIQEGKFNGAGQERQVKLAS